MKMKLIGFCALFLLLLFSSCSTGPAKKQQTQEVELIQGEAQGTTYSIKYLGSNKITKQSIDSLLRQIDLSLSAWVSESQLNTFNGVDSLYVSDNFFLTVFFRGKEICELTNGAFHPMIMPLVRAWGFGPDGGILKEGVNLDSLRKFVNYDYQISPSSNGDSVLFIKDSGYEIDVNGIAQGYSVDVISEFLESKEIDSYMVEIGGEVRASGLNEKGSGWRIGIDKPISDLSERQLQAILELNNASLATSGSYRKFYEFEGKRYSHTIDPSKGMPVDHQLLSVTVMTSNCTNADAFATAFMVMGVDNTLRYLEDHPELKMGVYMIYNENGKLETYLSEEISQNIEEL